MLVNNLLVQYADLIVGLMINQLAQGMLHVSITIDIGFYRIDDTIVSNSSFNNIITFPRLIARPAFHYKVQPFLVVSLKTLNVIAFGKSKLISVHYRLFCTPDGFETNRPFGGLLEERRKIETRTEVQVFPADANQRTFNDKRRTMK